MKKTLIIVSSCLLIAVVALCVVWSNLNGQKTAPRNRKSLPRKLPLRKKPLPRKKRLPQNLPLRKKQLPRKRASPGSRAKWKARKRTPRNS